MKGDKQKAPQSEYQALLGLIKKLDGVRNELEALSLNPKFCDGIFAEQFYNAQSRIDEILHIDMADPVNVCVLEFVVRNPKNAGV